MKLSKLLLPITTIGVVGASIGISYAYKQHKNLRPSLLNSEINELATEVAPSEITNNKAIIFLPFANMNPNDMPSNASHSASSAEDIINSRLGKVDPMKPFSDTLLYMVKTNIATPETSLLFSKYALDRIVDSVKENTLDAKKKAIQDTIKQHFIKWLKVSTSWNDSKINQVTTDYMTHLYSGPNWDLLVNKLKTSAKTAIEDKQLLKIGYTHWQSTLGLPQYAVSGSAYTIDASEKALAAKIRKHMVDISKEWLEKVTVKTKRLISILKSQGKEIILNTKAGTNFVLQYWMKHHPDMFKQVDQVIAEDFAISSNQTWKNMFYTNSMPSYAAMDGSNPIINKFKVNSTVGWETLINMAIEHAHESATTSADEQEDPAPKSTTNKIIDNLLTSTVFEETTADDDKKVAQYTRAMAGLLIMNKDAKDWEGMSSQVWYMKSLFDLDDKGHIKSTTEQTFKDLYVKNNDFKNFVDNKLVIYNNNRQDGTNTFVGNVPSVTTASGTKMFHACEENVLHPSTFSYDVAKILHYIYDNNKIPATTSAECEKFETK